ncbi:recombinase family protein [Iamia sp.]|uniref:recombinase family protein n=1 Tax=Iamia sp. TaxID=2722710 RepID=UPI002CE5803B|nr:recombinase family protein [Iamia sp.]HXH59083.1 recombinase family protein [Iamia sp.]
MASTAIYARISQDRTGAGLGVDRQEQDCRDLCDRHGWTPVTVFVDNDVSAYSGKPRPAYQRMLSDLKEGAVDRVVCWHPDRLHRSPRELEDFIDVIEAAQATVVSVTAGPYDLATPEGRLTARVVGSVARKESEDKSRRLRRKHLELAEAGEWAGGGTRPYGYHQDRLTVRVDEAAMIREATQRILDGDRLRTIAADWNTRGVDTVTGGAWTTPVLRRLLTSARIAGWREHQGRWTAEATWAGIVDRPTVERLRLILLDPARRLNVNPRRYLLTGLLRCGLCDARLVARPRSNKDRAYVCARGPNFHGCGKIGVIAEALEEYIAFLATRWLDTDAVHAARSDTDAPGDTLAQVAADEAALDQLARDHYVDRIISRSEYLTARAGVESRLVAARRLMTVTEGNRRLERYRGQGEALAARWETTGFDQRRAMIDTCVETITVGPGVRGLNRFDHLRVKIKWRGRMT